MTELPAGWIETSLGKVATLIAGSTPKGVLSAPHGDLPFYKVSDMNASNGRFMADAKVMVSPEKAADLGLRICPAGSVIFPKVGGALHTNKKRILRQAAAFDTNTMAVVPSIAIDARFLFYWLSQINLSDFAYGAPVPQVDRNRLANLNLYLPPAHEQRRIVAAIEEQFSRIDAGMASLDHVRANIRRMRAAVLRAAVTGALVPQLPVDGDAEHAIAAAFNARRKAFSLAGRTDAAPIAFAHRGLPAIPASWRWASLDSLAEVVGGITKDAKRETANGLVQVPYLRVANVQRGYLDLGEVTTIGATAEQIEGLRLRSGDILFNEGGDRDKLGRGWVWEGQIDPCIHQNHVFRARLYAPILDPRLVSWHGNTFGQQWFSVGGKQTTNLASVSKTTLRSFPVPVPPVAEQSRIVAAVEVQLSLINRIEAILETTHRRSLTLRSSVLSAAFAGRLVAQDPKDEPASTLLQRLAPKSPTHPWAHPIRTPQAKITR
jgi:type I restriction enzyme S subunit